MADSQNNTAVASKQVNIGSWISRGWDIVTADMGSFLLLGLIYIVILTVASSTVIGEWLVIGPLQVGIFYIIFEKMRGKPINIGDIAKGFNFFIAAVLSNILISIFSAIGFLLCIIPGLIIMALYIFAPPLIVEKNLDFWAAMEESRKVAKEHLFELTLFLFILALINLVGVLVCGIGIIFTLPLSFAAIAVGYDELIGVEKEQGE